MRVYIIKYYTAERRRIDVKEHFDRLKKTVGIFLKKFLHKIIINANFNRLLLLSRYVDDYLWISSSHYLGGVKSLCKRSVNALSFQRRFFCMCNNDLCDFATKKKLSSEIYLIHLYLCVRSPSLYPSVFIQCELKEEKYNNKINLAHCRHHYREWRQFIVTKKKEI